MKVAELAGREPGSPGAKAYDPDHWVLEMSSYQSSPQGTGTPGSRPLCVYTSHKNSHFNLPICSSAASSTLFYLQNFDPKLKIK